ncbi:hypothetical protein N8I71_20440 [Roseibacterium sp. SDUM158016]|uniref:hypothetical protein n=1 Tax=Roseicyclus sediminis TaxID=2980997 RepID=UPI0021D0936F|nr:hypothetical protein [Roseibacterium sp. SDUM158016]MCU4655218.1 hypothetical protein [Roseibacterium sp. SDUM158016]
MSTVQTTQRPEAAAQDPRDGVGLLVVALAGCVLFHGGLLPFTHGNTYDAFIHMFFGDSYARSWFDVWDPRWYTGFLTISYPPGTHMAIGALSHVMPLRAAFVLVQLGALLLLTVGVYRFSLLWVPPRAAGYAAIFLMLSSAISETVHLFGQLPTTFSLAIFLNGLPYVYRWIAGGGWVNFFAAVIFGAATTAGHHVTTIFGAVLFVFPIGLHALTATAELHPIAGPRGPGLRPWLGWLGRAVGRFGKPLGRGLFLGVCLIAAIVLTILPYWLWSVSDPITQVPIPHGSRENFLERTDLGFVFFLLPWGMAILFLPYALLKTVTTRLWPLGGALFLCFVLGTGGTTPISRAILGGAFDILTLDRFTFWATILILPFLGLVFDGLINGRSGRLISEAFGRTARGVLVGVLFLGFVATAVLAAILPLMRPTQPDFIDPAPIVDFMTSDQHDRWRYLTLGFGDQFAYLSAQMEAQSVDGNYHSVRRLPDMTRFSVERLENAKYMGVPGLGSLRQFLTNAEDYHLKYVFSNDEFYDPLLHFTGWRRLIRLQNGVVVWERPDVSPLPRIQPRRDIGRVQSLMWGLVPPTMLGLAALIFAGAVLRRGVAMPAATYRPVPIPQRAFRHPARVRLVVVGLFLVVLAGGGWTAHRLWEEATRPLSPEEVITAYYTDLDFRRFAEAHAMLDPETRPAFEDQLFAWRWRGGLIASYGKLTDIAIEPLDTAEGIADWQVTLDWLTALDVRQEVLTIRTVARDGRWHVAPLGLRPVQSPARLDRQAVIGWSTPGRRQPRPEADLQRDRLDRPEIAVGGARLVRRDGRLTLVGAVTNLDMDPAAITLIGDLRDVTGRSLLRQGAGFVGGQRLLPGETTGFRIGFESVLSLEDAVPGQSYDPTQFLPPILAAPAEGATLDARALVATDGHYRGVSLNGIRLEQEDGALRLDALAVNAGTETASVARITALLYDAAGRPVWVEAAFVATNIYPGQSAPVSLILPLAADIEIVAEIGTDNMTFNAATPDISPGDLPLPLVGTIPLEGLGGYAALRLTVSSMIHDPGF